MNLIFLLTSAFWYDQKSGRLKIVQRATLPDGKIAGCEADIITQAETDSGHAKEVANACLTAQQAVIMQILKQEGRIK